MPRRRPLRRLRRKLSTTTLTRLIVSVWIVITAGMVSFALVLSHTGPANAAGSQPRCQASTILLPTCAEHAKAPPATPKG